MNDDTDDPAAEHGQFGPGDFAQRCPDCAVVVGQAHLGNEHSGCDVARCLATGLQRLGCETDHDHGRDAWTGRWPGEADRERLGWMLGPGFPYLNRLYAEAVWDAERCAWITPTV